MQPATRGVGPAFRGGLRGDRDGEQKQIETENGWGKCTLDFTVPFMRWRGPRDTVAAAFIRGDGVACAAPARAPLGARPGGHGQVRLRHPTPTRTAKLSVTAPPGRARGARGCLSRARS